MDSRNNTWGRGSLLYALEGAVVGLAAGAVSVAYRLALEGADQVLDSLLARAKGQGIALAAWFCALCLLAFAVHCLLAWQPAIGGGGIPRVMGELQGRFDPSWWRVLLAKFAGGTLCALAGLSLGRAGPSAQLGAMAGKGFSRLTGRPRQEERLLLTCGVAAGIAATFNAPLAGLLFAGEVLRLDFRPRLLAPCMAAAVAADLVASGAFGLTPIFRFPVQQLLPLSMGWMWLLLGIFLGLLGAFYNRVVEKAQNGYERIGWRPGRLLLPFLAAGIAGLWLPSVLGGGTRLMAVLLGPLPGLGCLLGLLLAKMALSVLCFSSGAPGGLFLPVFSMGALCGGIWAVVAVGLGMPGSWAANCMVLAMAGLFAAVVRAPLTATVLCLEMTGSFGQLLSIAVVCITAWAVTGWLGIQPVYSRLLERLAKPGQNRA